MSLVRVHVHGNTGTIILNRPEKRNALSRAMLEELSQALGDLHLERRVKAVALTGAGPVFCAGMDLGEMRDAAQDEKPYERWQQDSAQYLELIDDMLHFPKPLIAAVNGPALAGGVGLMLACDLVIAAETASVSLPEPRRGIVAGMVAPLLAFRIGAGQAAYMLLTATTIGAARAHQMGLFHEIVHPDHLWPRATQLADECALSAPEALQLTKRVLNETVGEQLGTLLSAGAAASATARTTDAAKEGLAAFLEKRPPKWN